MNEDKKTICKYIKENYMEYMIVTATGKNLFVLCNDLEKKVKDLIDAGWKPLGGISVSEEKFEHSGYYTLAQAIIKE